MTTGEFLDFFDHFFLGAEVTNIFFDSLLMNALPRFAVAVQGTESVFLSAIWAEEAVRLHKWRAAKTERHFSHEAGQQTVVEHVFLQFPIVLRNPLFELLVAWILHHVVKGLHEPVFILVRWNADWHDANNYTRIVVSLVNPYTWHTLWRSTLINNVTDMSPFLRGVCRELIIHSRLLQKLINVMMTLIHKASSVFDFLYITPFCWQYASRRRQPTTIPNQRITKTVCLCIFNNAIPFVQ